MKICFQFEHLVLILIFVLVLDWPKDDDIELFQQMKKVLPKDDTMKYDSRLNYVDWQKVVVFIVCSVFFFY